MSDGTRGGALAVAAFFFGAAGLQAAVVATGRVADKAFHLPELYVSEVNRPPAALGGMAGGLRGELAALGVGPESGFFDPRTGRWSSLVLSHPLVPGRGRGNTLRWDGLTAGAEGTLPDRVWQEVTGFLRQHEAQLRVDVAELGTPRIGVFESGTLIQMHAPRVVGGVPVRDSGLSAVVSHGNLLLLGLQNWADVDVPAGAASLGPAEAREVLRRHLSPFELASSANERLELVPTLQAGAYAFRLAWVMDLRVAGDAGSWEGLVDAASGDLLQLEDRNLYASRQIVGGVYPVSNDLRPLDGIEQPGWPMPFVDLTVGSVLSFATSGGTLGCLTGTGATALNGRFLRINDACGVVNEPAALDIDLGLGLGTDCAIPVGHSAGDTHAARTAYYELNRTIEQAKGYLPANAWLQAKLTANTNLVQSCNGFWSPTTQTVNFYRDNGGTCRNAGEIASFLDHEWGHGLDDNGVDGSLSSPAEAIADIRAVLRVNNSCVFRGFFKAQVCGGYGDACDGVPLTGCTGARDADFMAHRCDRPHDIDWILNGFTGAQCAGGAPGCSNSIPRGPCSRETHCEGQVMAEVAWDLQFRDLRAGPFNLDANTSLELTTRLFYLAGELATNWYTCDQGSPCQVSGTCGCGATGGYLLVLAADDDNGDLGDGTPHMTAIRAAFQRHQLHCATQAVLNAGCAGGPVLPPVVVAVPGLEGVTLNWAAVPGASRYAVYRTESLSGCAFGKVKIGETTANTFVDAGLLGLRAYSYTVMPVGANPSCLGPASVCVSTAPLVGACGALEVAPQALDVDDAGNRVLEPGEAAVVAPTWRNAGLLGLNLTGTGYNFSGPAGPTYTVNDGLGIYGLMLPGSNQPCLDCYAASISSGPRPLVHWDANLTETVTPTLNSKSWLLHVGQSFTDVPTSSGFYRFVETILHKNVTGGCDPATTYCPGDPTKREQMAVFVLVSKEAAGYVPPPCGTPLFADVPASSIYCRWIEELARRGVSGGCAPNLYCPSDSVTREQMAVFVLRTLDPALDPPACVPPNIYSDVPETSPYCRWIEELTNRNVVTGCGGGQYCGSQPVTREQMSVFLAVTFGLTLYGI